jgi:hypothetical protein
VFEGCKIGQKPARKVTVEKVFAIFYGKNIPQRHKGHKEKTSA